MTLLLIPLQIFLAKRFAAIRSSTAMNTDARVRHISEVIDGIGSVKSYGWEKPFFSLIEQYRAKEIQTISQSQVYRAINQGLFFCGPEVAAFTTFVVYWGTGSKLTLPLVFSTLSLLQTLRTTMGRQWTRSMETGSEAIASCHRIEAFLKIADSNAINNSRNELVTVSEKKDDFNLDDDTLIQIDKSSYYYGNDSKNLTLRDIEFSVKRGELLIIVGSVGSGKSSLLAAILDEISVVIESNSLKKNPYRHIRSDTRIAYCSQRPWILAASVRANITMAAEHNPNYDFKHPKYIEKSLYKTTLESCRIVDDMLSWQSYDFTEIGERGVSVSGGQKARISLGKILLYLYIFSSLGITVYSSSSLFKL